MGCNLNLKLDILPSYNDGHLFVWGFEPIIVLTGNPKFTLERGDTTQGPWSVLADGLVNVYAWRGDKLVITGSPVLYYRVRMSLGSHILESNVSTPYGKLDKRDFLILAEMMRKELLHAQLLAGVPVKLFVRNLFGASCTVCKDPVTGVSTHSRCSSCFGTGNSPAYNGPYDTWAVFSQTQQNMLLEGDNTDVKNLFQHSIKVLGSLRLKKDDIILDPAQDKRYFIGEVKNEVELRRIPVTQLAQGNEIPNSSPLYSLGI